MACDVTTSLFRLLTIGQRHQDLVGKLRIATVETTRRWSTPFRPHCLPTLRWASIRNAHFPLVMSNNESLSHIAHIVVAARSNYVLIVHQTNAEQLLLHRKAVHQGRQHRPAGKPRRRLRGGPKACLKYAQGHNVQGYCLPNPTQSWPVPVPLRHVLANRGGRIAEENVQERRRPSNQRFCPFAPRCFFLLPMNWWTDPCYSVFFGIPSTARQKLPQRTTFSIGRNVEHKKRALRQQQRSTDNSADQSTATHKK